mmetsp:Transcript_2032/g.5337  ORF Transcript_2032/g.5337 Transcript_2032/m.5337 type:complete len:221 (-) Transcript_2032:391-1053(-)
MYARIGGSDGLPHTSSTPVASMRGVLVTPAAYSAPSWPVSTGSTAMPGCTSSSRPSHLHARTASSSSGSSSGGAAQLRRLQRLEPPPPCVCRSRRPFDAAAAPLLDVPVPTSEVALPRRHACVSPAAVAWLRRRELKSQRPVRPLHAAVFRQSHGDPGRLRRPLAATAAAAQPPPPDVDRVDGVGGARGTAGMPSVGDMRAPDFRQSRGDASTCVIHRSE